MEWFGMIFSGVIVLALASVLIAIGVKQRKSKMPVGFYTGEKPPKAEEITDVEAWNKKHGLLWIVYGIVAILGWASGWFMENELLALIPFCIGFLLPIPILCIIHHRLKKRYMIKK